MSLKRAEMSLSVPIQFKKEKDGYIVSCPVLDVVTQGRTKREAKANILDALVLFIQNCLDHGTLDAVLKQCGFKTYKTPPKKLHAPAPRKPNFDFVDVPVPLHIMSKGCQAECRV